MRKSLETWETSQSTDAELDSLSETLDEVEAIEGGEVEVLDVGSAVNEVGEGARQARREESLFLLIVGELAAVSEAVALSLLDAEVDLTLVESF